MKDPNSSDDRNPSRRRASRALSLQEPDLQRSLRQQMKQAAEMQRSQMPDASEPIGDYRLHVANAGKLFPFLLRSLKKVAEVPAAGLAIGLFNGRASATYRTRAVELDPGDVLLVASDGIRSIEGDNDQCFDGHRLLNALTRLAGCGGAEVIDSLVSEAVDFSRGRPLPDDINLVTISRDSRPRGCQGYGLPNPPVSGRPLRASGAGRHEGN